MTTVDHLEADQITIPGQNYALISVVSSTSNQQHKDCGVKIRGVFSNKEDAKAQARKLQKVDKTFDVFLVEMYKWLLIPPNIEHIDDQTFQDDKLNSIVQEHKDEQIRAQEVFESRKHELKAGKIDPIDEMKIDPIDEIEMKIV
jgi:hypothetical protein